jgi:hypothetical protein
LGRGRDDEVKLRQDRLEALFSTSELIKLGKVNLATRELKTQRAALHEVRKLEREFEWTVLLEVDFVYRRER